jgi:hypothetical protein
MGAGGEPGDEPSDDDDGEDANSQDEPLHEGLRGPTQLHDVQNEGEGPEIRPHSSNRAPSHGSTRA